MSKWFNHSGTNNSFIKELFSRINQAPGKMHRSLSSQLTLVSWEMFLEMLQVFNWIDICSFWRVDNIFMTKFFSPFHFILGRIWFTFERKDSFKSSYIFSSDSENRNELSLKFEKKRSGNNVFRDLIKTPNILKPNAAHT